MESVKSEKVLPVGTFYLLYLHKSQKIRIFARQKFKTKVNGRYQTT